MQKGLISPDFKGLSQEYPSFELLWFDIMTRSRHLMAELLEPVIDQIVGHKDNLNQLKKETSKSNRKIEELKETIFNTNNKLDVFEQINMRLATLDADRKVLEEKVDFENDKLKSRMDEIDHNNEVTAKVFSNLQTHST